MSVKLKFNSKLRRTIGELFFFCISTTLTLKDDRIKLTYHNKSKSEKESSQKKNSHNKSVQYIWQPKKKKVFVFLIDTISTLWLHTQYEIKSGQVLLCFVYTVSPLTPLLLLSAMII